MNFLRSESEFSLLLLLCGLVSTNCWSQSPGKPGSPDHKASRPDWSTTGQMGGRLASLDVGGKDPPALPVDVLLDKMMTASARRATALRGYRETRSYNLEYHGLFGARQASMRVAASYTAPEQENFTVVAESGSKLLLSRVLLRLLDSEREAFRNEKQIELSPANYHFHSLGIESASDHNPYYVLEVEPREQSPFLYRGKVWVDAYDFALARMEGQPAKSPSFWIKDTHIDSIWQKTEGFWFIRHSRSVSHVRMGGTAILTIDYTDYRITNLGNAPDHPQGPQLPNPSAVTPER
jgi:hypothetical protein